MLSPSTVVNLIEWAKVLQGGFPADLLTEWQRMSSFPAGPHIDG